MRRRRLLTLFLVQALVASVGAMECEKQPFDRMDQKATVIFSGTVSKRVSVDGGAAACDKRSAEKPDCGAKVATFKVNKVWKGKPSRMLKVFSEDACSCLGSYFKIGDEYLVFAVPPTPERPGIYNANNVCYGTQLISDPAAQEIVERLNAKYSR